MVPTLPKKYNYDQCDYLASQSDYNNRHNGSRISWSSRGEGGTQYFDNRYSTCVPVRDSATLNYVKYGPGHEKYPSWPIPAAAELPQIVKETIRGGSHRSKSWTDNTTYPKEKIVDYVRPYMKPEYISASKKKYDPIARSIGQIYKNNFDVNERFDDVSSERSGLGSSSGSCYSIPERDNCNLKVSHDQMRTQRFSLQHEEFQLMTNSTLKYKKHCHTPNPDARYQYATYYSTALQANSQNIINYTKTACDIETSFKQVSESDRPQSELTHTPFLDRLCRDSDSFTQISKQDSHISKQYSPVHHNSNAEPQVPIDQSVIPLTSSNETLHYCCPSNGSIAKRTNSFSSSARSSFSDSFMFSRRSSKQLIAHSARVLSPQKHNSESVVFISSDMSGNGRGQGKPFTTSYMSSCTRAQPMELPNRYGHCFNNNSPEELQMNAQRKVVPVINRRQTPVHFNNSSKKLPEPGIREVQKEALLQFYKRHHNVQSDKANIDMKDFNNLSLNIVPPPLPPKQHKKTASSTTCANEVITSRDSTKICDRSTLSIQPNACQSNELLSMNTVHPGLLQYSTVTNTFCDTPPIRPPKLKPQLLRLPNLSVDIRTPSPDVPLPSPPELSENEIIHNDEPLPSPPLHILEIANSNKSDTMRIYSPISGCNNTNSTTEEIICVKNGSPFSEMDKRIEVHPQKEISTKSTIDKDNLGKQNQQVFTNQIHDMTFDNGNDKYVLDGLKNKTLDLDVMTESEINANMSYSVKNFNDDSSFECKALNHQSLNSSSSFSTEFNEYLPPYSENDTHDSYSAYQRNSKDKIETRNEFIFHNNSHETIIHSPIDTPHIDGNLTNGSTKTFNSNNLNGNVSDFKTTNGSFIDTKSFKEVEEEVPSSESNINKYEKLIFDYTLKNKFDPSKAIKSPLQLKNSNGALLFDHILSPHSTIFNQEIQDADKKVPNKSTNHVPTKKKMLPIKNGNSTECEQNYYSALSVFNSAENLTDIDCDVKKTEIVLQINSFEENIIELCSGLMETDQRRVNSNSEDDLKHSLEQIPDENSIIVENESSITSISSTIETENISFNTTTSHESKQSNITLSGTSPYFTTSEAKAKLLTQYLDDVESSTSPNPQIDDFLEQKEKLVIRLDKKLDILRSEQLLLSDECKMNDELGENVEAHIVQLAKPQEIEKFKLHIEEVGKITTLLLSLSGRLARAENALVGMDENNPDKPILENKRERLLEQMTEARKLKDCIDKRSVRLSHILTKYLNTKEYMDYDHFIQMKTKLIVESKEIAEKIKLGEEQLHALKETLSAVNK